MRRECNTQPANRKEKNEKKGTEEKEQGEALGSLAPSLSSPGAINHTPAAAAAAAAEKKEKLAYQSVGHRL